MRFPDAVEGAAFFVVSECFANTLKHADATRVTVRLAGADGALHVEVADDGGGLRGAAPATSPGITDRVAALGGRLAVARGAGTRACAVRR